MTDSYTISAENKARQLREKASYDRATVHGILDAGLVIHAAFIQDGNPVVVPMIYGRDGETIYVHGARKARVIRMLESSRRCCLNLTLVDGLVFARSAFNSSMQYRSVTVFGTPRLVEDSAEKLRALKTISEQSMPGRWNELRDSHEKELKMTGVIAVAIDSASAKISAKEPEDEDEDYAIDIWAGVIPIKTQLGSPVDDSKLRPGLEPSAVVTRLAGRTI